MKSKKNKTSGGPLVVILIMIMIFGFLCCSSCSKRITSSGHEIIVKRVIQRQKGVSLYRCESHYKNERTRFSFQYPSGMFKKDDVLIIVKK